MAQAGFTPISLYFSTTAAAVPSSANLVAGELALNTVDEKLYFKNSAGTVKLLASNATSAPVLSFQTSLGGLTPSTATTGVVTLAGTLNTTSGGTGLTSFTAGDVPYYASGSVLSKLAIGTAGQFLTSTGTAPQWSTLSGVAVTTFSAGTTGFTPNTATSGAVTLAGTLGTANGGTNLGGATPFVANGVVFASSSSVLATGSTLTFNGNDLGLSAAGPHFINLGTTSTNGQSVALQISAPNSDASASVYRIGSGLTADNEWTVYDVTSTQTVDKYIRGASGFRAFYTNGSERARIDSSGNVNIGTTGIAEKLVVNGAILSRSGQSALFSNTTSIDYNASNLGRFIVTGPDSSTYPAIVFANTTTTTYAERMRIDADGNLLVGTTSATVANSGADNLVVGTGSGSNGITIYSGNADNGNLNFADTDSSVVGFIQYQHAGNNMNFRTNGAEAMRIDSSGNVGIGTSSPSGRLHVYGGTETTLTVGNSVANDYCFIKALCYPQSANGYTLLAIQANSSLVSSNAQAGELGFTKEGAGTDNKTYFTVSLNNGTSITEKLRITSAGNVGIGTSSPTKILQVVGTSPVVIIEPSLGNQDTGLNLGRYSLSGTVAPTSTKAYLEFGFEGSDDTYSTAIESRVITSSSRLNSAADLGFFTKVAAGNLRLERMTITDTGRVGIGTTSPGGYTEILTPSSFTTNVLIARTQNSTTYTSSVVSIIGDRGTTNSTYNLLSCYNNGTANQFLVRDSGNAENTNNSYGAVSDVKLKENIVDASPKLADLMQVKVRSYNLKSGSAHKQLGVIAQELETVFPAMVEEAIDRDTEGNDLGTTTKSVKYSVFVPMLIKAIQEQQAIIESLKARLDAANL